MGMDAFMSLLEQCEKHEEHAKVVSTRKHKTSSLASCRICSKEYDVRQSHAVYYDKFCSTSCEFREEGITHGLK